MAIPTFTRLNNAAPLLCGRYHNTLALERQSNPRRTMIRKHLDGLLLLTFIYVRGGTWNKQPYEISILFCNFFYFIAQQGSAMFIK